MARLARLLLVPALVCGSASRCVFAPPVPDETTTTEGLSIDRTKVSPLTSVLVRRARIPGSVAKFDITDAIQRPSGSSPIYVSWWVGFDPKSPIIPPTPAEATSFEVVPCDSPELRAEGEPVTVVVEALVGTSQSIAYDFQRADPRFAADGSELIFIQWTLVVEGGIEGCVDTAASGRGPE